MAQTITTRVRGQLSMLTIAFLLGMAVNLIGLPSETSGGTKTATSIFLGLHGLVGLGLLVGAILTSIGVRKTRPEYSKLAGAGGAAIGLTLVCGLADMATESNWWAYLMGVGFIASFLLYGKLFVQLNRAK